MCERQVRCCESTSKVRDALKEEPRNSMVDCVMHADARWQKVVILKSATSGSEQRDGKQAVMAKRVAQAPTLQASLDFQAMITDVTS